MTFVERHCITFEQAKELSELGVPNISAFKYRKDGRVIYPSEFFDRAWESDTRTYPCFTDSELIFITGILNKDAGEMCMQLAYITKFNPRIAEYYFNRIKRLLQ